MKKQGNKSDGQDYKIYIQLTDTLVKEVTIKEIDEVLGGNELQQLVFNSTMKEKDKQQLIGEKISEYIDKTLTESDVVRIKDFNNELAHNKKKLKNWRKQFKRIKIKDKQKELERLALINKQAQEQKTESEPASEIVEAEPEEQKVENEQGIQNILNQMNNTYIDYYIFNNYIGKFRVRDIRTLKMTVFLGVLSIIFCSVCILMNDYENNLTMFTFGTILRFLLILNTVDLFLIWIYDIVNN